MNPKKVWSIILIVFGGLFAIGGAHSFYDTCFNAYSVEYIGRIIERYVGDVKDGVYLSDYYNDIIFREKTRYMVLTLFGIATTILGAVMLQEVNVGEKEEDLDESDLDLIIQEEGRWVL